MMIWVGLAVWVSICIAVGAAGELWCIDRLVDTGDFRSFCGAILDVLVFGGLGALPIIYVMHP